MDKSLMSPALNALFEIEQAPQTYDQLRGPFRLVHRAIRRLLSDDVSPTERRAVSGLTSRLIVLAQHGVAHHSPYLAHYSLSCLTALLEQGVIQRQRCQPLATASFLSDALQIVRDLPAIHELADGKLPGPIAFLKQLERHGFDVATAKTAYRKAAVLRDISSSQMLKSFCKVAGQQAVSNYHAQKYGLMCGAVEEMARLLASPNQPSLRYFGEAISPPFLMKLADLLPTLSDARLLARPDKSGPYALFKALAERGKLPDAVGRVVALHRETARYASGAKL